MALVRRLLLGAFALVILAGLAILTVFWWAPVGVDNYVNKVSLQLLLSSPQSITQLGLIDDTPLDFHSGRLDTFTPAQQQKELALARRARAGLDRYGPAKLEGQQALTWAVAAHFLDDMIAMDESPVAFNPYRINQISGPAIDGVAFLTDTHVIKSKRSAQRYVSRVVDFARVLDEVRARTETDRAAGVTPPDFVIDKTLVSLRAFIDGGSEKNILVTSLATRLQGASAISADDRTELLAQAKAAVEDRVIPSYQAIITLMEDMRKTASHDAGVWRIPGGPAFYAMRLRSETTADLTPDQIHDIGLSEVARIEAEMTAILDKRGVPTGVIGQRIDTLMQDPEQLFPNTDAGREAVIAYLRNLKTALDARASQYFVHLPKQKLEIVRVPDYSQDSAPGGYYMPPALDGSRPGRFYINLKNTADWPRFTLPTLYYHEAEPGHHFQLSAAQDVANVPMLRRVVTPTAYAEGWGLYAERLAFEAGLYADDPLGDLGRLQSEMFRAVRLVVDTGMHAKKWTREQAIAYMRDKTGMTEADVTREIERYVVWPGQACSYKIGMLAILRLRDKAKTELGSKFDIRTFHDHVLMNGGLPLNVLEKVIDDWIAETKPR